MPLERDERFCYSKKDFKIDWFSGTGAGGQHRNKTQNCVRITHIPSGLKSIGQRGRSRRQNFSEAFQALGKQLEGWIAAQINKEAPERIKNPSTIRTYHAVDNRIVDHLSGFRVAYDSMEQQFGALIEARRNALATASIGNEQEPK